MWQDQRGSTTVTLVIAWTVIMLCIALGADVGRAYIIREQLRTAEDAASLAGAQQLQYRVEMRFTREVKITQWICDEDGNLPGEIDDPAAPEPEPVDETEKCTVEEWVSASPLSVTGPEGEVWAELPEIWRDNCSRGDQRCYSKSPTAYQCWLEPIKDEAAIEGKARSAFAWNEVWGNSATRKSLFVDVIGLEQSRPKSVQVIVDGQLEMKSFLLGIIGIPSVGINIPGKAIGIPVRRGESTTTRVPDASGQTVTLTSPCDA